MPRARFGPRASRLYRSPGAQTDENLNITVGAVVTRAPAVTDLDQDPLKIIETGDWVKVDADNGIVEVTKR